MGAVSDWVMEIQKHYSNYEIIQLFNDFKANCPFTACWDEDSVTIYGSMNSGEEPIVIKSIELF